MYSITVLHEFNWSVLKVERDTRASNLQSSEYVILHCITLSCIFRKRMNMMFHSFHWNMMFKCTEPNKIQKRKNRFVENKTNEMPGKKMFCRSSILLWSIQFQRRTRRIIRVLKHIDEQGQTNLNVCCLSVLYAMCLFIYLVKLIKIS